MIGEKLVNKREFIGFWWYVKVEGMFENYGGYFFLMFIMVRGNMVFLLLSRI